MLTILVRQKSVHYQYVFLPFYIMDSKAVKSNDSSCYTNYRSISCKDSTDLIEFSNSSSASN